MKKDSDLNTSPLWVRVRKESPWVDLGRVKRVADGDLTAAEELVYSLRNQDRGALVKWVFETPHNIDIKRKVLALVWEHDHRQVIHCAGNQRKLMNWFREADFSVDHLPETFSVWRGTSHLTLNDARQGFSWSTEKATACWFALRRIPPSARSTVIVLRRDITRNDVLFHWVDRSEDEVILMPGGGEVDGNIDEWMRLAVTVRPNQ